jgi:hypothetical protein
VINRALKRVEVRLCALCFEPISKLFEEDNEAGKLDKAKEIVGVVLPANKDPALPLNPGKKRSTMRSHCSFLSGIIRHFYPIDGSRQF